LNCQSVIVNQSNFFQVITGHHDYHVYCYTLSNFIVACAFVTCYENRTYLLTYLLTYNGKNAFKTFPDPESEADDFKKTTVTYLSKDTSLVTFS